MAKDEKVAVARNAGVRIEANGQAWKGSPANLRSAIAPVRVSIWNNSGRPLRVRYEEFKLSTAAGFTSAALPPRRITGSVPSEPVPVTTSAFGWSGYWLAPYYSPWYPGFGVWTGPFAWDFPYYTTYYAQWPVALPTENMLSKALPEGVLDREGHLEGFLYFPQVPSGTRNVNLIADLVDARTGAEFGKQK